MSELRLLALLLSLLLLFGCIVDDDADLPTGSGVLVTEDLFTAPFDRIRIDGPFDYRIVTGEVFSVSITADDNALPFVVGQTTGGEFSINFDQGTVVDLTLDLTVTLPRLADLRLSRNAEGELLNRTFDPLLLELGVQSELDLAGAADELTLEVTGQSEVRGFDFTARRCAATVNQASEAEITVTDRLSGSVDASSELRYRGRPELAVEVLPGGELVDAN